MTAQRIVTKGNDHDGRSSLARDTFRQATLATGYKPYGLIAHAMGAFQNQGYTNSPEAFLASYDQGFRIFEVDLVLLADGTVLAAHPGLEADYGLDHPFTSATLDELHSYHPHGRDIGLSVLTGSGLVRLLADHEDALLVTDTKDDHAEILQALVDEAQRQGDAEVADRLVPHVRDPDELASMAAVHDFGAYILALYRSQALNELNDDEVIDFVRANHIAAVMMWWRNSDDRLTLQQNTAEGRRFTTEFVDRIRDAGAVVYVHSLNDPERIQFFRSLGVGVYSDGYIPPD